MTEVPESLEVPYSTLPRYTLTPRNVHNELPDVHYDGHPGLPLVLSDLLGHQGEVHRAQPLVVQGSRALAAAAGHSDDKAGLVDHEAGGHLIKMFVCVKKVHSCYSTVNKRFVKKQKTKIVDEMKKVPNSNGTNYVKNKSYDEINFKPLSNTDIKLL